MPRAKSDLRPLGDSIAEWRAASVQGFEWKDIVGRQADSPFAEFDFLGRKRPRRLGVPDYLLMILRIDPARVRRVPARAIVEDGGDEEGFFTLVECPCEHRPIVRQVLGKCPGCERYYVAVEPGSVYVAYGAMVPPPLPIR